MIAGLALRPTPAGAARVLREVFGHIGTPFAFRLWDGTDVRLGDGPPVCTAVFKSAEAFANLMRDPSPGHFAEAYVTEQIDLDGDLFATMEVANAVEEIKLSSLRRLKLLLWMLRG